MRSRRALTYPLLSEALRAISANLKSSLHWNGHHEVVSGGGMNDLSMQNSSAIWKRVGHLL